MVEALALEQTVDKCFLPPLSLADGAIVIVSAKSYLSCCWTSSYRLSPDSSDALFLPHWGNLDVSRGFCPSSTSLSSFLGLSRGVGDIWGAPDP